jgi:hypothetical protein
VNLLRIIENPFAARKRRNAAHAERLARWEAALSEWEIAMGEWEAERVPTVIKFDHNLSEADVAEIKRRFFEDYRNYGTRNPR